MHYHIPWVLPTGKTLNPTQPETATFYNVDQVAYVLQRLDEARTRPTRVVTSYGSTPSYQLGDTWDVSHDQTSRYLGRYEVVGIVAFAGTTRLGEIPDLNLAHAVFK